VIDSPVYDKNDNLLSDTLLVKKSRIDKRIIHRFFESINSIDFESYKGSEYMVSDGSKYHFGILGKNKDTMFSFLIDVIPYKNFGFLSDENSLKEYKALEAFFELGNASKLDKDREFLFKLNQEKFRLYKEGY